MAYDGPAALELAGSLRPDVVLVDLGLPGMDGYGVARRFRQQAEGPCARLIAVTGYADEAHRSLGKQAGFDAYLIKPVDFPALEKELRLEGAGC